MPPWEQPLTVWEREQQLTLALESIAGLVRVVALSAGVSLADIECRRPPASADLRRFGPDQRWRGAVVVAPAVEAAA